MCDYKELLKSVSERPGMYLPDVTLFSYISYINGLDSGQNGGILQGLREWLIIRRKYGNNLVWWSLASDEISSNSEEGKIRELFKIINEFFQYRNEKGFKKIYLEYQNWLESQEWYDKDLDT